MIVKREKYYTKYWNTGNSIYDHHSQKRKRTTYWLFGIIPVFINIEVLSGDYE